MKLFYDVVSVNIGNKDWEFCHTNLFHFELSVLQARVDIANNLYAIKTKIISEDLKEYGLKIVLSNILLRVGQNFNHD